MCDSGWLHFTTGCIIPLRRKAAKKNSLLFQLPESSPSSPKLSVDLFSRQLERCLEGPIGKKQSTALSLKYFAAIIQTLEYIQCSLYLGQVVQNARDGESLCHKLCHRVHVNESSPQGLQVGEESVLVVSPSCVIRPVTDTTAMERACKKRVELHMRAAV